MILDLFDLFESLVLILPNCEKTTSQKPSTLQTIIDHSAGGKVRASFVGLTEIEILLNRGEDASQPEPTMTGRLQFLDCSNVKR